MSAATTVFRPISLRFARVLACATVLLSVPGGTRDAVHAAAERTYGYGAFDMVQIASLGAGEHGCPSNNGGYPIARDLGVIR